MPFGEQVDKLAKLLDLSTPKIGNILGLSESTVRMYKHRDGQTTPQQVAKLIEYAREHGVMVDLEYFYLSDADPAGYAPMSVRERTARYEATAGRDVTLALALTALAQNLRALSNSVEAGTATPGETRARLDHAAAVCRSAEAAVGDGPLADALTESAELLSA